MAKEEFAWIEAPKDKKFRLIKVATSKLKLGGMIHG